MLRVRQLFRLVDCELGNSLLQKSTALPTLAIAAESSLFRQKRALVQNVQKNFFATSPEPSTLNTPSEEPVKKQALGKIVRKLRLSFTCKRCGTRNTKTISKLSYEEGIVIVRCDGCKNNHLIADNLGWFGNLQDNRNIESILAKRGETVCKIQNFEEGSIQIFDNKDIDPKLIEKDQTFIVKPPNETNDTPKS